MTEVSTTGTVDAVTTGQAVPPVGQQPTGIQINDLQLIMNIIDLASQRGAFRANELTQVGSVADKLGAFLGQVAQQAKAEQDAKDKAEGKAPAPAEASAEAPAEASSDAPSSEAKAE
tara:strand:+ start:382 stop:732 length:351 start_codon:yes stop_codon:yes gene_type:complete